MFKNTIDIISEIGWNHMGNLDLAKKMILASKESGATIVKFQVWDPSYLKSGPWDKDGRREIYNSASLDDQDISDLINFCNNISIDCLFSVFGTIAASRLISLNVKNVKIPSHEITNIKLCELAKKNFDKIYISTGASKEIELKKTIDVFKNSNKYINLMHCVSSYPCDIKTINLPRINWLKQFKYDVGFSDHTSETITPALAIISGASVIEKHFTIDNELPGRDNKFALTPDRFKEMVGHIEKAFFANKYIGNDFQESEEDIIYNYRGRWEPADYED